MLKLIHVTEMRIHPEGQEVKPRNERISKNATNKERYCMRHETESVYKPGV